MHLEARLPTFGKCLDSSPNLWHTMHKPKLWGLSSDARTSRLVSPNLWERMHTPKLWDLLRNARTSRLVSQPLANSSVFRKIPSIWPRILRIQSAFFEFKISAIWSRILQTPPFSGRYLPSDPASFEFRAIQMTFEFRAIQMTFEFRAIQMVLHPSNSERFKRSRPNPAKQAPLGVRDRSPLLESRHKHLKPALEHAERCACYCRTTSASTALCTCRRARMSSRHGVQHVAKCVACAALTLVVWQ